MTVVSVSGPPLDSGELATLVAADVEFRSVDVVKDGWQAIDGAWAHVLGGAETIDATVAATLPASVEVVCFVGTGYRSYVDAAALRARGIEVCYTPHANAWSTAEFAITLLLAARRRLLLGLSQVAAGEWNPPEGLSLPGATIGVVGFGHVAQHVIRVLVQGFGARVLVWNRSDRAAEIRALGAEPASLEAIFAEATSVTIHVDSPEQPLITRELLESTPAGFSLVNTARAGAVDYFTLRSVLDARPDISVVGDVYPTEPVSDATDTLGLLALGQERFAVTPHMAYLGDHAAREMSKMVVANLRAALGARPLPFAVPKG